MKYGRLRGEARDMTEEEKVTEQEEIWTGCVKWAVFLRAAVTAVVQDVCAWTQISASCRGIARGSHGRVWLCCARARTLGCLLHAQWHSETSRKSTFVRAQQLAFASSDIPAACTQLEQAHERFTGGEFMVTAHLGVFGSLKGAKKEQHG